MEDSPVSPEKKNDEDKVSLQYVRSQTIAIWVAAGMAFLSLIVSGYSVFMSYKTQQLTRENLVIEVAPFLRNYNTQFIPLSSNKDENDEIIVSTVWTCTLSNTSSSTISITSLDVRELRDGEKNDGYVYSHLAQGIYDISDKWVDLPLNIEAGHSKKVYLRLGLRVTGAPSSLIQQHVKAPNGFLTMHEILLYLAKNELDLLGNKINRAIKPAMIAEMPYRTDFRAAGDKNALFRLTFGTARGSTKIIEASYYPFGKGSWKLTIGEPKADVTEKK